MLFEVNPCYATMKRDCQLQYTWLVHSWLREEGQTIVEEWDSLALLMDWCLHPVAEKQHLMFLSSLRFSSGNPWFLRSLHIIPAAVATQEGVLNLNYLTRSSAKRILCATVTDS